MKRTNSIGRAKIQCTESVSAQFVTGTTGKLPSSARAQSTKAKAGSGSGKAGSATIGNVRNDTAAETTGM